MASMTPNSGIMMMLKAMGIDPAQILQKGAELEALGKILAAELHAKVTLMEHRMAIIESTLETRVTGIEARMVNMEELLSRIESVLGANLTIISKLESSQAGITPAGETYEAQTVQP